MSVRKKTTDDVNDEGDNDDKVVNTISLPAFQIVSDQNKVPTNSLYSEIRIPRKSKKKKSPNQMDENTTTVEIHSTPVKVHSSSRKSKSHSRHERHKCHKSKHTKPSDSSNLQVTNQNLIETINELKYENYLLNKKLNVSLTSIDSGLSQNEMLPPFEVNVNSAYQHVKNENVRISNELELMKTEFNDLTVYVEKLHGENKTLNDDILMLKNLVYKLNVELEKYQGLEPEVKNGTDRKTELLPLNYNKNFLKPILPLLKAYSETIIEKNELVEEFENEFKRFNVAFNDLLKENEKLYRELERKLSKSDCDALDEVKVLKKDLEMARQENQLLLNQIELGKEKLLEVHSVYRIKVADVWKQKESVSDSLQEQKADLYMMRGKYSVLKQEYERLKLEIDARVPLAVHSASISECKRLFQDLKSEYEAEKKHLTSKIKEQEDIISRLKKQVGEWAGERNELEKSNFDQTFENEALRRRVEELENRLKGRGFDPEKDKSEIVETKRLLRESNRKVEELNSKLITTRKQLHKAMSFAEDIVREQEGLLMQLHAKQKENNLMATQFGSLKSQLKDVEKGAHENLNSIEEKIKALESENLNLLSDIKRLKLLLKEKEEIIRGLEPTRDSTS